MKKEDYGTCPRCEKEMTTFPALSRRDNKTDICSNCGQTEAMEDYYKEKWTEQKTRLKGYLKKNLEQKEEE